MQASDRGSALVDFVFLAVPFVLVPLTVISVSVISYAQTVLRDSAIEGARYAALADQESSGGCDRATGLAKKAFGGFADLQSSCRIFTQGNTQFEQVNVKGMVPVFGILVFSTELSAIGRAPREN